MPAPALLDALAAEGARTRLRGYTTQALANTAWSFASAAHAAPALFLAVAAAIERAPLDRFRPHELALLAWAFAAADEPCEALCGQRFVSHLARLEWRRGSELAMLHQCAHAHRPPATRHPPPAATATATATATTTATTALQPRLGRGRKP